MSKRKPRRSRPWDTCELADEMMKRLRVGGGGIDGVMPQNKQVRRLLRELETASDADISKWVAGDCVDYTPPSSISSASRFAGDLTHQGYAFDEGDSDDSIVHQEKDGFGSAGESKVETRDGSSSFGPSNDFFLSHHNPQTFPPPLPSFADQESLDGLKHSSSFQGDVELSARTARCSLDVSMDEGYTWSPRASFPPQQSPKRSWRAQRNGVLDGRRGKGGGVLGTRTRTRRFR